MTIKMWRTSLLREYFGHLLTAKLVNQVALKNQQMELKQNLVNQPAKQKNRLLHLHVPCVVNL